MLAREWSENGFTPENYNAYTGRCSGSPHYNWGVLMGLPLIEELVNFKEDRLIFGNPLAPDGTELNNILADGNYYNMKVENGVTNVWRNGVLIAQAPGCAEIYR